VIDCPAWFTERDLEEIARAERRHAAPAKVVEGKGSHFLANAYASDADALEAVLAVLQVVANILPNYRGHPQFHAAVRSLRDQRIVDVDPFRPKDTWTTFDAFETAVIDALAASPWWLSVSSSANAGYPTKPGDIPHD